MFEEKRKKKRFVFLLKQQSVRPCAAAERDDDDDDEDDDDDDDDRGHALVRIQAVCAGKSERLKIRHGLMVQEVERGWGRRRGYRSRGPLSRRNRLVAVVTESESNTSTQVSTFVSSSSVFYYWH